MSENNASLKMVRLENKGRALVASRPLRSGEVILRDSPILLYPAFPAGARNYCSHCFRTISGNPTTMVSCPVSCSRASIFCTPQCLSVANSTSHTPFVCRALSSLRACSSPLRHNTDERHLQAQFLIYAYNLAVVSASNFQTLLSLQGESIINAEADLLHSLISSICCPLNYSKSIEFSLEMTADLLARDKLNAFGLMEPFDMTRERSVRAYGIYPRASFFNHDCLPNACRFDYLDSVPDSSNTDFVVRILHDVPEGREICLSYFPVNLKYSERQARLNEGYGFTCDCDRCKVEADWPDIEDEMEQDENGMEVDSDGDLEAEDCGMDKEENDFPHAYFFMRYMCNEENCWGTLAPLPPVDDDHPSTVMECSFCGNLSNSEDL